MNIHAHQAKRNLVLSLGIATESGFTIVEIIVAAVLLSFVAGGTALTLMSANRSGVQSELLTRTSAAIDTNVAAILERSERFTCCSGVCTANPATIAAAGTKCTGTFGDANYYFPSIAPADVADLTNFLSRCKPTSTTNGLVGPLIAEINSDASLNLTTPPGITRTIQVDDPADLENHRLRITFTGNGLNRVVKIVPNVAVWCP